MDADVANIIDTPLVSVIIPAYNASAYIKDAIDSLLAQSVANFECIIIDDCSSDSTYQVAKQYTQNDGRFLCVSLPSNGGTAAARNKGISLARGKYIAFLDADDLYYASKLEVQLEAIDKFNVRMVCCSYELINSKKLPTGIVVHVDGFITYKMLLKENIVGCSTVLMDAKLIKANMFRNEFFHEDYACWLDCLKECGRIYGINQVLAKYSFMAGTKSRNKLRSMRGVYQIYRRYCSFSLPCVWLKMVGYIARKTKKYFSL